MEILMTSIRIIDYRSNSVYTRETPPAFDEYVNDLISHINENTSVRDFKTKSPDTEVISCVKQIVLHRGDNDIVQNKIDIIANRLLEKEIEVKENEKIRDQRRPARAGSCSRRRWIRPKKWV